MKRIRATLVIHVANKVQFADNWNVMYEDTTQEEAIVEAMSVLAERLKRHVNVQRRIIIEGKNKNDLQK